MLIIRLEYTDGGGMYSREDTPFGERNASPRHPLPEADAGMSHEWERLCSDEQLKWYFGFSSVQQCLRWMYSEKFWERAERLGLLVVMYEVPAYVCIVGYTQATFLKSKATPVQVSPPLDWFRLAQQGAV